MTGLRKLLEDQLADIQIAEEQRVDTLLQRAQRTRC